MKKKRENHPTRAKCGRRAAWRWPLHDAGIQCLFCTWGLAGRSNNLRRGLGTILTDWRQLLGTKRTYLAKGRAMTVDSTRVGSKRMDGGASETRPWILVSAIRAGEARFGAMVVCNR